MIYALIKNGTVHNIIVAEPSFVDLIRSEWDHIAAIAPEVGIGWGWNGDFVAPPEPEQEAS